MNLTQVPNTTRTVLPARLPGAQIPEATSIPPDGVDWLHEVKVDGYRMMARIDGRDIRLVSRHGVDWTDRFKTVLPALSTLSTKQAILRRPVCLA